MKGSEVLYLVLEWPEGLAVQTS